jgi:hypothetical protein
LIPAAGKLVIFAALIAGAFLSVVVEYALLTDVLVSTASVEPVALAETNPVVPVPLCTGMEPAAPPARLVAVVAFVTAVVLIALTICAAVAAVSALVLFA